MPKSPATRAAVSWLDTRTAPSSRCGEVAFCTALLSEHVPLFPSILHDRKVAADVLMATVLVAERQQKWPLVELIRDHSTDKKGAKLAKKVLFRAEQRGQLQREKEPERSAVDLSAKAEPPPSYCTSFDRTGCQVVLWGGADEKDGAFGLVGIVEPTKGIESVSYVARPSRTRMRQLAEDIARRFGGLMVEVSGEFAAGRLASGLQLAVAAERSIEGDAGAAKRLLAGVSPNDGIEASLEPTDADGAQLAASAGLFELPCFSQWCTNDRSDIAATAASRYDAIESDDRTPERAAAAVADATEQVINADRRAQLATQFAIAANLLVMDEQADVAAAAIAVSSALRDASVAAAEIPYIRAAVASDAVVKQLLVNAARA